jgi:hypothetical protein
VKAGTSRRLVKSRVFVLLTRLLDTHNIRALTPRVISQTFTILICFARRTSLTLCALAAISCHFTDTVVVHEVYDISSNRAITQQYHPAPQVSASVQLVADYSHELLASSHPRVMVCVCVGGGGRTCQSLHQSTPATTPLTPMQSHPLCTPTPGRWLRAATGQERFWLQLLQLQFLQLFFRQHVSNCPAVTTSLRLRPFVCRVVTSVVLYRHHDRTRLTHTPANVSD